MQGPHYTPEQFENAGFEDENFGYHVISLRKFLRTQIQNDRGVFKFLRPSMDGKHLMRFRSENAVRIKKSGSILLTNGFALEPKIDLIWPFLNNGTSSFKILKGLSKFPCVVSTRSTVVWVGFKFADLCHRQSLLLDYALFLIQHI